MRGRNTLYALNLTPAMSYTEIGAELGLSNERVRQIIRGALHKLRKEAQRAGVGFADFYEDRPRGAAMACDLLDREQLVEDLPGYPWCVYLRDSIALFAAPYGQYRGRGRRCTK